MLISNFLRCYQMILKRDKTNLHFSMCKSDFFSLLPLQWLRDSLIFANPISKSVLLLAALLSNPSPL